MYLHLYCNICKLLYNKTCLENSKILFALLRQSPSIAKKRNSKLHKTLRYIGYIKKLLCCKNKANLKNKLFIHNFFFSSNMLYFYLLIPKF